MNYKNLRAYYFPFILLSSILLGGICGYVMGPSATLLKPLGDIFLNLLFTAVIPLVFFSVASAVANISELKRFAKILLNMFGVFLFTGLIAAVFMLIVVKIFPLSENVQLIKDVVVTPNVLKFNESLVNMFTAPDLPKLFSRDHLLALVFFAILIGMATFLVGEKAKPFLNILHAGTEVFMKLIGLIMYYAPIGFFAYFAVLVGVVGPQLAGTYFHLAVTYYIAGIIYFIFAFTFYAFLAGKQQGVKTFWQHIFPSTLTALATCSSSACISVNLETAKKMGMPAQIYQLVAPLGAMLHKDGSVLGGIVKIAFLFHVFQLDFSSFSVFVIAIIVGILVGTVMGAIPSGGMVGEMLILSVYGFPTNTLMMIAAISIIIDPLATMLNVTGDTIASMLVTRLVEGKNWLQERRASVEK